MKKHQFLKLVALFLLVVTHESFAQKVNLESLLARAVSLSESGKTAELVETLKSGSFALESEANTRGNEMKDKLLGQTEALKSLIPLATAGTLKTDELSKVVNTIRLLVGANRINNLLGEGKEALLGNAEELTTSISMLQSGKAILDSKQQDKLGSLLDAASEPVKKLDDEDNGAKVAASAVKKTLGKIVDLVKEAV
ncbi:hypothetical protein [Emticicia sp. C21]|uniref:hypothetical protein n=1 Tax=Emticicia sp. C21 TaxID=2302915 RepID=UPI000E356702|nr:hypothetical protein [Emticicia sp. C21]RFS16729.1 hypothetical protein D0T08_08585 [Emticicia sp. C21]